MSKVEKIREKVLSSNNDKNIFFDDLRLLLKNYDFEERIKGSHHIFTKNEVDEILNLQPRGKQAKPYQVKQVRDVIVKYKLGDKDE